VFENPIIRQNPSNPPRPPRAQQRAQGAEGDQVQLDDVPIPDGACALPVQENFYNDDIGKIIINPTVMLFKCFKILFKMF